MKYNIKHLGQIEKGKMKYDDPKTFVNVVKGLEGERVELVIKKHKPYKQRSEQQNAYYWAVIIGSQEEKRGLAYEIGYTKDEMHEVIKLKFLGTKRKVKGRDGKEIILCKAGSTADLSTTGFETLMSKIRSWSSMDMGIFLPSPNEVDFEY